MRASSNFKLQQLGSDLISSAPLDLVAGVKVGLRNAPPVSLSTLESKVGVLKTTPQIEITSAGRIRRLPVKRPTPSMCC